MAPSRPSGPAQVCVCLYQLILCDTSVDPGVAGLREGKVGQREALLLRCCCHFRCGHHSPAGRRPSGTVGVSPTRGSPDTWGPCGRAGRNTGSESQDFGHHPNSRSIIFGCVRRYALSLTQCKDMCRGNYSHNLAPMTLSKFPFYVIAGNTYLQLGSVIYIELSLKAFYKITTFFIPTSQCNQSYMFIVLLKEKLLMF